MTSPDVAVIEARLTAATDRPWTVSHGKFGSSVSAGRTRFGPYGVANSMRPEDAEFIAHAPADIAALLAEVKRVRASQCNALCRDVERDRDEYEAKLAAVRQIAFDPDVISALERGVIGTTPDTYGGINKDEAIGYAVDALRDIRDALDEEPTDPGCPHCGDFYDPDRPDLHARCRRIPDAETRRDGRDG